MKKLLITGFEPFGGETINPSWEAVNLLPSEIGEYSIDKLQIPVAFGFAFDKVIEKANHISPDAIICVGQAGGRSAITPEFVGINLKNATIPDNLGNQPKDEDIILDGDCAYFSTIPVRRIAEAINSAGIASQISYSAGTYVCNELFYRLLARYKNTDTLVGFVHVPYSKEQNKEPSMELDEMVRALILVINELN